MLQVVEPHLVGPSGEVPAVFYSAKTKKVEVLCGQGTAPSGATIEHYKREGLELIPGNGLLATVVPGAFDAWMLLLRDHGLLSLREVLEPAIYYAEQGHPLLPRVCRHHQGPEGVLRDRMADLRRRLPARRRGARSPASSSATRSSPIPGSASSARRKRKGSDREAQIEGARNAFYKGFVAEAIDAFVRKTEVMDQSGSRHRGVLTADDMAKLVSATYDAPQTYDYHDYPRRTRSGPGARGPSSCRRWRC